MKVLPVNYITVCGWMRSELHLNGNELLLYALIYGFSQEENQWCESGLQYICDWLGVNDKSNVRRIISRLVDKGVIIKQDELINGVKFCKYRAVLPRSQNDHHPVVKTTTNNIDIVSTKVDTTPTENNNPIILFNDKDIPTKETSKERRFVKPTLEQVKAYCEERGNNIDPQHFIDYYESNGWMVGRTHMKDWKAAIRTWERKEVKQLTTPRYGNTINQSGNGVAAAEQPRQRTYTGRF